jgi:alpha-L-fucosidase
MRRFLILACVFQSVFCPVNAQNVAPYGPLPTPRQLRWEDTEFYLFTHFGPNTFTDLEWGKGTEKEEVFNPTALDCRQWCRVAKAAGAKGIIITAKHHDGFCLWPSKYSTHTIAQSTWRNGKGDVVKELADACKEYGLKLGIYLSPWDRNHPKYGTSEYNEVFVNMMKEVVARYGPLFEFWWDGANGEGPNGKKMVYDFPKFERTIRSIAPNTAVFSDIGPDMRWVGNENGVAGSTNWALLDTAGFTRGAGGPSTDSLNRGNINGKLWVPAECDVSIRPGWFYHKQEDSAVRTPEQLFALYLKSVGRGANLLLNVPPDRRGLFTAFDSAALIGFKKLRDESFSVSLLKAQGVKITVGELGNGLASGSDLGAKGGKGSVARVRNLTDGNAQTFVSPGGKKGNDGDYRNNAINIQFPVATAINCIMLQEPIQMGQRVKSFLIRVTGDDGTVFEISRTTIGHKRIVTFPRQSARSVSIVVTDAKATPLIGEIGAYLIREDLVEKE